MNRSYYDEVFGGQRVSVKLAALHEAIDHLEGGDIGAASRLLRVMAAAHERKQLRAVRDEVYRRFRHAQAVGDAEGAAEAQRLLDEIAEARAGLTA